MKFSAKYTKKQKAWCENYESVTGFEPLMDDFEAGNCSFKKAAHFSVHWFEEWMTDALSLVDDAKSVGVRLRNIAPPTAKINRIVELSESELSALRTLWHKQFVEEMGSLLQKLGCVQKVLCGK